MSAGPVPQPARVAFLGPLGTFTHQGVVALRPDAEVVPVASAGEALAAVAAGEVTYAVLPIDNSINGVVVPTLDGLMAQPGVSIVDSVVVPVSFDAFVSDPSVTPRIVVSHPHALAQCRGYIDRLGLPTREAVSTAAACRDLQPGEIGLGPAICGELYGQLLFDRAVEDNERALTQFALIANTADSAGPAAPSEGAGGAGLLVGVLPDANIPGLLRRLLGVLEERGINMTNLVTRPVPHTPGIFEFLLFLSGTFSDADVAEMRDAWAALGGQARALGRISPLVDLAGLGGAGAPASRPAGTTIEGFARACVVGAGLIGGSVAHRLHEQGLSVTVVDPDADTRQAANAAGLAVAEQVPADADLVVVAAPLDSVGELLVRAAEAAPSALVVDVGSVKEPVERAVSDVPGVAERYVGAHPMNGAEVSGFGYARGDLLTGITWAVTYPAELSPGWQSSVARVVRLLTGAFGSRVVVLDAAEHDRSVALISHLPHVLANTLLEVVERADAPTAKLLAAGSFREGTRVAGRNPARTRNMLADNAAALGSVVDDVAGLLEGYRAAPLADRDALLDRLTEVAEGAPDVRRPALAWTTVAASDLDALLVERGAERAAVLVRGAGDGAVEWAEP